MPIARGPGAPARSICARMYCISSDLTVSQSSSTPWRHRGSQPPAATPDIESKALGEMRIVRQKIQPLAFHGGASTARDAPHLQLQNDPQPGALKVANSA